MQKHILSTPESRKTLLAEAYLAWKAGGDRRDAAMVVSLTNSARGEDKQALDRERFEHEKKGAARSRKGAARK